MLNSFLVFADGYVHVYDIRSLPASGGGAVTTGHTLATLRTSGSSPSHAARKVKFSSNNVSSELLAFTEVS